MNIESRLIKLEENQLKLADEIQKLKQPNHPEDFNSWWNSLDQDWKTLFRFNIENNLAFESWWKDADYFRYETNFQPTLKFYEKRLQIKFFSCKLMNSSIFNLEPLTCLNSLIGLNCNKSNVDDLSPISHLTSIKYLNINDSRIDDLTPISKFADLEYLDYQNQFDSTKDDLTYFPKLKSLNIRYGNFTDISFVENFANLEYLNVAYSNLKSIKPLLHLNKLNKVYMVKTDVPEAEIRELKEANPNCEILT